MCSVRISRRLPWNVSKYVMSRRSPACLFPGSDARPTCSLPLGVGVRACVFLAAGRSQAFGIPVQGWTGTTSAGGKLPSSVEELSTIPQQFY